MSPRRVARLGGVMVAAALLAACGQDGAGVRVATSPGAGGASTPATRPTSVPPGAEQLDRCPASTFAEPPVDGLPTVTLPCLGRGPDVRMAGLRGRPRLVNVWASWCPPCRAEMPWLQEAYADGIDVVGVDAEDQPEAAGQLVAALGVRYPSVDDPGNELGREIGVTSKPVTLFVTAEGAVVHTQIGPFPSAEELRSAVARYLGVTLP